MERKIIFRGKRIDNGEWVYGDLIANSAASMPRIKPMFIDCNTSTDTKVIAPNTIGQFTGLLDKNSKEIYEGDIITFDNHLQGVSQVVYDYAGFDVVSNNYRTALRPKMNNHIRVIGNIHDNPELIKQIKEE